MDVGGLISRNINGNPDEGISMWKRREFYLYSSTLGPLNASYKPGGFDTSYQARQYYTDLYTSLNINAGTISVQSMDMNLLYRSAAQQQYWGGYNGDGLYNGLGTYPPIYEAVQAANADPNSTGLDTTYYKNYITGLQDGQPDEFSIRLPGYTGKFSLNTNGVPQLNPVDNDIKLSYTKHVDNNDSAIVQYIDGWSISTADGKKYYFGYGANATPVNKNYEGSKSIYFGYPVIEWYLTKIVDTNTMDSVIFSYDSGKAGGGRKPKQNILFYQSYTGSIGGDTHENWDSPYSINKWAFAKQDIAILKSVTTNKETINFYSNKAPLQISIEPPRLDSIQTIDRISGKTANKWNLYYDYFVSTKRLKLVAFEKQSLDPASSMPPTSFEYDDSVINPVVLSDASGSDTVSYTPLAQDYWGYYNNQRQNYFGLFVSPQNSTGGANRKAAWPYMQLNALKKINAPTGGQTLLEYEPHSAVAYANNEAGNIDNPCSLDTIGGLRIKTITYIDSLGSRLSKRYTYATGQLNTNPTVTQRIEQNLCVTDPSMTEFVKLSNYNNSPKHNYGVTVNYGEVKEETINNGGVSQGYTIYKFYNDYNSTDTNFLTYKCQPSFQRYPFNGLGNMPDWQSHHSMGGNLLNGYEMERSVYAADNTLLKKRTNYYQVKQYPGYIAGFDFFFLNRTICEKTHPLSSSRGWDYAFPTDIYRDLPPPPHYYYYMNYYAEYPKSIFLSKQVDVEYSPNAPAVVTTTEYYHNSPNHISPTKLVRYSSLGDTLSTINLYAFDFANNIGGDTTLKQLQSSFNNPLISTIDFRGGKIASGKVTRYKNFGTISAPALFPSTVSLHRAADLAAPTHLFGAGNTVSYPVAGYFADDNFKTDQSFVFSPAGLLLEKDDASGFATAYLWDYRSELPVAEAVNATKDDIAYTSFEADGTGNWTAGSALRDSVSAITGTRSYNVSNGAVSKSGLAASKKYIVSYWTKNGAAYSITGTQSGYPKLIKSLKGWNYYEHLVTGVSSISISGSGSIDELRLYPSGAQMQTFTYKPLTGLESGCDKTGTISYYKYDGLQRLITVQNESGQVLKQNNYAYSGKAINLTFSQTFTKSCTTGYQGSSVTYTVPLGQYKAATMAQANQLALNDIAANGQNYANANGTCSYVYKNVAKDSTFTKNDCGATGIGSNVKYTVAAGTYSSIVSQADADAQALSDIRANGQNYANANGSCTYPATVNVLNKNYPNDIGAKISVTLTNTVTSVSYSYSNIAGGVTSTKNNIPSGTYNITITGAIYTPNQAFGITDDATGTIISCLEKSGTSYSFTGIAFSANASYTISQISECIVE